MKRTSPDKEKEVLTLILRGDTYAVVAQKTGVPISTIKKIKRRSDIQAAHLYDRVAQEQANSAISLLEQTNRQISRLLAKADLGLVDISVYDLCKISNEMHRQTTINLSPGKSIKTLQGIAQKYQ